MMAGTTRTLNPLHFEDLEPKRFEDLIRQLIYDFKNWRRLEATGRSGSDDGFDARGYEQQNSDGAAQSAEGEDEGNGDAAEAADRLWLIQCKREKVISPSKMKAHLAEIKLDPAQPLYGLIFAAACDFSKATRDVLAAWCRDNGVSEWHLWGKAELEDQLLQPKNDGILFAYFGISLTIRRRSKVSEIRRQIAIKRKLGKLLEDSYTRTFLLRDIDDERYPYDLKDNEYPRWRVREIKKVTAQGLLVRLAMRPAWISEDGTEWDAAFSVLGQDLDNGQDQWHEPSVAEQELNSQALDAWRAFPDEEKAWLYTEVLIPYSRIVLIDDVGDDAFEGPHLFLTEWDAGYPLGHHWIESMKAPKREVALPDGRQTANRVSKFPEGVRNGQGIKPGF